ncbi:hypothetical protein Nepgr_026531 [Nepenthes gracilis]|uniref:Uncharacterized protein n=1 Tax=Nepenthes gracilis TaxID=150966 RepID=A0AAD3Y0N1_NEPGR|nr:hypothetical protein Nepgr_026531 [Nepenthes gracilis]
MTFSKDTPANIDARLAKVEIAMDNIYECLSILNSRVEEHEDADGLASKFQGAISSLANYLKEIEKFRGLMMWELHSL